MTDAGIESWFASRDWTPFDFQREVWRAYADYVLAGHIHPGARLAGTGCDRARLPCFWFSESVGVLPAFGDFTGLAGVDPAPSDQVWVIADDEVIRAPSRS